ncbi:MAG: universal stress protein [Actinobacteria bacterium]|nr:universal stress protein [Actinomycetota bacterium]
MGSDAKTWQPRRVLVGYDGSDGGRDAIALGALLAEPDAEFLLVDVIPPVGLFTTNPRRLEDEEPPQSRGFFFEALRDLPDRRVETRTYVANSAARVLSEVAEEESFDLIAIGPCYPGIVGRILLGSVGAGLMHGAAAPVAAATRGYDQHHRHVIREIAVAWDGSPEAHEAVLYAEVLARREAASLRLITVDVRETTLPGAIGWEPLVPKTPAEVLEEGVSSISPDLKVEGKLIDGGSIAAAIAEECRVGVDLLVLGSRGYGALGRVLVGSVGTALLHRVRCPMLAVPRPRAPLGEQSFRDQKAVATG